MHPLISKSGHVPFKKKVKELINAGLRANKKCLEKCLGSNLPSRSFCS